MFNAKHKSILMLCLIATVLVICLRPHLIRPMERDTPVPHKPLPSAASLHDKTLKLATVEWPPFNFRDSTGQYTGVHTEIVLAVLKGMGYEVTLVEIPFKRILREMRAGTYPAMLPCQPGSNRNAYMLFSDPVGAIQFVLWKKKDNPLEWKTYDDLKGLRVGATNYLYGAGFFEAANEGKFILDMLDHEYPDPILFRKLIEGRTDMFVCERSVGEFIRHQHTPEFDAVDYALKGIGPMRPFCFPLSKKYFERWGIERENFMARFNQGLAALQRSGFTQKVFEKYNMNIPQDEQGRIALPERD